MDSFGREDVRSPGRTRPELRDSCERLVGGTPLCVDFLTETYPPEINGVARTLERLVHGLAGRGHAVRLIRPRQNAADDGSEGIATTLVSGMPLPGYAGLRFGFPAAAQLARLWHERRPDVIYVATEGPLGWSAVRAAERAGIPAVSGFHTHFPHYTRHYGFGFLKRPIYAYLRHLHNRTRCTLVPTEELRHELRHDFRAVQVLGRGVDCGTFSPRRRSDTLRGRWGAGAEDRVVLYVGRLAAEKNLPLALQTFRAMRAVNAGLRFVVVGGGPLYQPLARDPDGVIFTGALPREALIEHYASADIFLFPSESETFGNVTLEAMASGLAVVAFDYAAAHQLIEHGINGILARPGDHAGFLEAALAVAHPGVRLDNLRAAARLTAEAHGWPAVIDRFETIMRQCAGR